MGTLRKVRWTEKGPSIIKTALHTLGNGKTQKSTAMESSRGHPLGHHIINTMATGSKVNSMARENSPGKMDKSSKATGTKARWKAKVYSHGPTILHILAPTSMVKSRAREYSHIQTKLNMMVLGKKTRKRAMGK